MMVGDAYNPLECCHCSDIFDSRLFLYRHFVEKHPNLALENPHENCKTCLKMREIEKYLPISDKVQYSEDELEVRGEARLVKLKSEFETICQEASALNISKVADGSNCCMTAISCCKCGKRFSCVFDANHHYIQGGFDDSHDPLCKRCEFFATLNKNITFHPIRDSIVGFYLLDKDLEEPTKNISCCCGCNIVYASTLEFIMHYVFSVSRNGTKHSGCSSCNLKDILGEDLYYRKNAILNKQNVAWFYFLCREFLDLAKYSDFKTLDSTGYFVDFLPTVDDCPFQYIHFPF